VIGTERHEARRIDNQLRGRAGRQGDPGGTQFFVSMEDTVMRVFGSDRMKGMIGKLGVPEDQPIENKLISKAIEAAQAKIEGFNFDARKHVLEYDDVLNHQRNIIYKKRRDALLGDDNYVMSELERIFAEDEEGLRGLEKKRKEMGDEKFFIAERMLILQAIDMLWLGHLEMMDYMRSSVSLRAYGNRDPLIEYKNEGLRLFKQMVMSVDSTIAEMALRAGVPAQIEEQQNLKEIHAAAKSVVGGGGNSQSGSPAVASAKAGRNDPCPCGSGKKYKKCCGA
jgi:preprotein translocase subunit SecA